MKLELKQIKKSYGNTLVLDNFSLVLEDHEIVVIQGPSGIGKTTVLRCINQLENIEEGSIELNGTSIYEASKQKENRQRIGYIFQNYQLFPHMNVLDNLIEAPLYHKLMTKQEAINQAIGIMAKLGIENKEFAYPHQLSGGQKQRVAIARACMLQPEVLCFDEPTAALDPASIQDVVELIQSLAKTGMGILVVSHDAVFAKQIATRIVSM